MRFFYSLSEEFQEAAKFIVNDAIDIGLACRGERRHGSSDEKPLPFIVTDEFVALVGTMVQHGLYANARQRGVSLPDFGGSENLTRNIEGIVEVCIRDNKKIKPRFCKGV